jgi:uncharacterized LabA/DUF88 family protein
MARVERIYVACDVSNLWKACREEFGQQARVDFQVLANMVPASRHPEPVRQKLVAYLVTNPKQSCKTLYRAMRGHGFDIRERFMRFDKSKGKPTRTDWDVGITIDALHHRDSYDTFVLISGDGDFSPLLRHLRIKCKKRTLVYSFNKSLARSLYSSAEQVIRLTEDVVYQGTR